MTSYIPNNLFVVFSKGTKIGIPLPVCYLFIQAFNNKEYTIGFKLSLYKFLNQSVYFHFHRVKRSKVKGKDRKFGARAPLANTQPALFPNMPANVSLGSLLIPKAYIFLRAKNLNKVIIGLSESM